VEKKFDPEDYDENYYNYSEIPNRFEGCKEIVDTLNSKLK
jgi:hypothetical protein